MFTFNQIQTILIHLAKKLHSTDNGIVYQFLRLNTNKSVKFYYADDETEFTHLYYAYKDNWHIRLCFLSQETFNSLLVSKFIDTILVDAEAVINLARDEQVKPYLTRIDNL